LVLLLNCFDPQIVSIFVDWTSINRAKLCWTLGRTGGKLTNNGMEIKNLNTVLGVTGDDVAAKLISSITLSQIVEVGFSTLPLKSEISFQIQVMLTLAQKKRSSTPLLRSLAFNISGSSEQLDLRQCADVLYSMAVPNFSDPVLVSHNCSDVETDLLLTFFVLDKVTYLTLFLRRYTKHPLELDTK
jgi:hypothetical protein